MSAVTMRELLEAGVHFGHQTRRWNPKMRRFIFGERGGIYIIDLQQTMELLNNAHQYLSNIGERNGTVLFVGTKKQCQDAVEEHARRVSMPYVNHRWLGGLLTNYRTIQERIGVLHELRRQKTEGQLELLPPKERQSTLAELEKLEANLGGVADTRKLPDAVVVIDMKKEALAVREARRLNIPVIGLVDTNCDPDDADFVIPGNDDAIRSSALIMRVLADGVAVGRNRGVKVSDFVSENGEPAEGEAAEDETPAAEAKPRSRAKRPRRRPRRLLRRRPRRRQPQARRRMSDVTYRPTAAEVKQLRETTQAGMMDCKRALEETGGDMDAAVRLLREKGIAQAGKRAGRGTGEGIIETYVHAGGKIAAMVEIGCETDFVARNDNFREFARKVALQIAAGRDLRFVSEDEISDDFKAGELEIFRAKAAAEGKPEKMLEQISEGMWKKSLTDYVLLNQPSIKPEDDGKTVETLRAELSGTIGENIEIKRFARFEVGAE